MKKLFVGALFLALSAFTLKTTTTRTFYKTHSLDAEAGQPVSYSITVGTVTYSKSFNVPAGKKLRGYAMVKGRLEDQ